MSEQWPHGHLLFSRRAGTVQLATCSCNFAKATLPYRCLHCCSLRRSAAKYQLAVRHSTAFLCKLFRNGIGEEIGRCHFRFQMCTPLVDQVSPENWQGRESRSRSPVTTPERCYLFSTAGSYKSKSLRTKPVQAYARGLSAYAALVPTTRPAQTCAKQPVIRPIPRVWTQPNAFKTWLQQPPTQTYAKPARNIQGNNLRRP